MRLPLGWAAIVCVMALSGIAHGQIAGDDFGIERFRMSTAGGMLDVDSALVGPHLDYSAGLTVGFAHNPLVIYDDQMKAVDPLVERRLTMDLTGSLGLFERVQLGFGATIVGYQSGTGGLTLESLPKGGLGDFRLVPKVLLHRRDRFAVALVPELTVPGGSARGWLREDGVTFAPAAAVSTWNDRVSATLNVGYRFKPRIQIPGLVSDDEAFARLGIAYGTPFAMVWWSTSIAAPLADATQNQVALETLLGLERGINENVIMFAAGGAGLANGFGTPDWRALVGVAINKPYPKPKVDPNPYKGEQHIEVKQIDVPPVVVPKAKLTGTVTSSTGQSIPNATVSIGSMELTTDENGHFATEIDGGAMTIDAVADGYDPGKAQITIAAGASGDVTVTLQRKVRQGQLRGQVLSFAGKPVPGATVTVGDKSTTSDADGNYSIDLPAGSFDVTIEASGFATQKRKVSVKLDAVTVLNADMRAGK
ncbi:MAG TPA: carboxypeptidase regulatory-like domain-containing protein [Kofleriaceae bacterium]|nr:carboxypeptidase regulatory-like domain-containing protein [Kofleriaceae bacterium]